MRRWLLALALPLLYAAAASAEEEGGRRVLVLDLERGGAVSEDDARALSTLVATAVSRRDGLQVIAGEDVRRMLALEGEKQQLDCDAEESCLAELAGALAADWIVFGQVTTLGEQMVANLTLFDARRVEAIDRVSIRGDIHTIGRRVEREALVLVGGSEARWPLLGGAVAGVAGAGLLGGAALVAFLGTSALNDASSLTVAEYQDVQVATLVGSGALLAAGATALVASGWLLFGPLDER